jgi:hypothetical protein
MSEPISEEAAQAVNLADRLGLPQPGLFTSVDEVILDIRSQLDFARFHSGRAEADAVIYRDALAAIVSRHLGCTRGEHPAVDIANDALAVLSQRDRTSREDWRDVSGAS